jgi:hypothetical protein
VSLVLIALFGCHNDFGIGQGASGVGNPGSAKQELARGGLVTYTSGTVFTDALEITHCSDGIENVAVDTLVDLLDDVPVEVPGGSWCMLDVQWTAPLIVEGANEDGESDKGTFHFELDVTGALLVLQPRFKVDEEDLIVEVGYPGWFQGRLELEDRTHTDVLPGDRLHDELVEQIELGSALYVDTDGDGTISDAERAAGPLAQGPEHDPQPLIDN